jgi:hypothetical protein
MNKEIMRQCGLGEMVDRFEVGLCSFCGAPISMNDFRDRESRREYRISGACQVCQDSIFKSGEVKAKKQQDSPSPAEDMVFTPLFGNLPRGNSRNLSYKNFDELEMEQADSIAK